MTAAAASSLPLLYARPRPVQAAEHGALSLNQEAGYRFAATAHSVPLVATEFFQAQRDYPIVFSDEETPLPMAVLGLKMGENLFVDGQGGWRSGAYIPAYVRRYPFIFAESPGSTDLTLCIDEGAEAIETSGRRPLFQDGQPTEIMRNAMEFCVSYQRDHLATRHMCDALKQADLLVLRDARVRISAQDHATLRGFRMIDEAKLNELPPETFLDWRKKGWVPLLYAHLMSLGAWDRLALIAAAR